MFVTVCCVPTLKDIFLAIMCFKQGGTYVAIGPVLTGVDLALVLRRKQNHVIMQSTLKLHWADNHHHVRDLAVRAGEPKGAYS